MSIFSKKSSMFTFLLLVSFITLVILNLNVNASSTNTLSIEKTDLNWDPEGGDLYSTYDGPYAKWQDKDTFWKTRMGGPGDWSQFTFTVPATGTYQAAFEGVRTTRGSIMDIYINGEQVGTYNHYNESDPAKMPLGAIHLDEGINEIKFVVTGSESGSHFYQQIAGLELVPMTSSLVIEKEELNWDPDGGDLYSTYDGPYAKWQDKDTFWKTRMGGPGDWSQFTFNVPVTGTYQADFKGVRTTRGSIMDIYINGEQVGTYNHYNESDPAEMPLGAVHLNEGINEIKFVVTGSDSGSHYYQQIVGLELVLMTGEGLFDFSASVDYPVLIEGQTTALSLSGLMVDGSEADFAEAESLTIASNDTDVINVDSGTNELIAVGPGRATVTATLKLGGSEKTTQLNLYVMEGEKDYSHLQGYETAFGADFNPTGNMIGGGEGYAEIITDSTVTVNTASELIVALNNAQYDDVIYVDDQAVIDLTHESLPLIVKEGVTLASGRGKVMSNGQVSEGALLKMDNPGTTLIKVEGPLARITGLRMDGSDYEIGPSSYYSPVTVGIKSEEFPVEVDNNEIYGFSFAAIKLSDGYVHHNYIHHNVRRGLGYGVVLYSSFTPMGTLIEANMFDWNRHSIAASGLESERYTARFNHVLENHTSHAFDMHGKNGGAVAGDLIKVHHNTFTDLRGPESGNERAAFYLRGKPVTGSYVQNNWFFNPDPKFVVEQGFSSENMFVGKNRYGTGTNISYHSSIFKNRTAEYTFDQMTPADHTDRLIEYDTPNRSVDFKAEQPGDYITYNIDVPKGSGYDIILTTGKSSLTAGIAEISVDGNVIGSFDFAQEALNDGSSDTVSTGSKEYVIATNKLTEGQHKIKFEVTGKNVDSSGYDLYLRQIRLYMKHGLMMSVDQHDLAVGATTQIQWDESDVDAVYFSSNEDVAVVSEDGIITAMEEGVATVTGKVNGLESTVQITVNRTNPSKVYLETIMINTKTTTLLNDEVVTLDLQGTLANGRPANLDNAIISYQISNRFIAKVNENGVIRGMNEGEAVLWVDVTLNGVTRSTSAELSVIGESDTPLHSRMDIYRTGNEVTIEGFVPDQNVDVQVDIIDSNENIIHSGYTVSDINGLVSYKFILNGASQEPYKVIISSGSFTSVYTSDFTFYEINEGLD